jgi:hypothetical protein
MTGIERVTDDFKQVMDHMLSRAASFEGAAARIYPLYQKFQTDRFQSENSSEGSAWPDLNESYKESKLKRFQSFPGHGSKMMIATGTLAGAVIGPGSPFASEGISAHRALFTPNSMEISIDTSGTNAQGKPLSYAKFAAEKRPIMEFSDDHLEEMKDELQKFILEG